MEAISSKTQPMTNHLAALMKRTRSGRRQEKSVLETAVVDFPCEPGAAGVGEEGTVMRQAAPGRRTAKPGDAAVSQAVCWPMRTGARRRDAGAPRHEARSLRPWRSSAAQAHPSQ